MPDDPWFWAAALVAVLLSGLSKGGFGGGPGSIATPLLALTTAPMNAAAIMLPILCFMDILGVRAYRRHIDWPQVRLLAPAALVGIAVGAACFQWLNADVIAVSVGMVAVSFSLLHFSGMMGREYSPMARDGAGRFWGAVAGLTSFITHAGGPPVSIYLIAKNRDKTRFVGTAAVFFLFVNYAKLVPYAALGLLPTGNLLISLYLLPVAWLGMRLGIYCHYRLSGVWFFRVIYATLLIVGLRLLYNGASGLLGAI